MTILAIISKLFGRMINLGLDGFRLRWTEVALTGARSDVRPHPRKPQNGGHRADFGVTGVFTLGDAPTYEAPEMLDHHAQLQLKGNLQQIDYSIFAANREVFQRTIPELDQQSMIRFAVMVSEIRAAYVGRGLALSQAGHPPTEAEIAELATLRQRYDEMEAAFRATRRLIERGYSKVKPTTHP